MNTEPTNQPPEWAVKAADELLLAVMSTLLIRSSQGEARALYATRDSLAAIIASHAKESVNQRLVDAVRRAEHFLSSVAGHKHVICGNEGQVEIDGVWIDCADLQNEFRSAIQSAEQ